MMIYMSSTFTYCSSNDTTCSSCREKWLNESSTGHVDPIDRCVGTDGCVCIAACEVPDRDSLIVANMCLGGSDTSSSNHGTIIAVGVIVGVFILFVLCASGAHLIRRWRALGVAATREMEEREAQREARRPAALANVPQLNLGGWAGLHDKLVETEHGQLGVDAKPTLSSTASTAVTIEEDAEGYRPLSPSDRRPRQRDL
ncbi:hypothetical protein BBJ28_00008394 [Nothophytophthora sp. Chile5]|nr:hypothetical protein BBJ28_00008394 [Nothophytophthora sp. Chile5]